MGSCRVQIKKEEIKNWFDSLKVKDVVWVIGLLVISRVIPHWPNVTALGATAIFAPRWLNQSKLSLMVPLLALLISDLIIGFHPTMEYTYSAIFLVSILSWRSKSESLDNASEIVKWGLGSSFIFFLVTNFGAWLMLDIYQKNIFGLILSYWNGIPFFFYDFVGTILYIYLALYLREKEKAVLLKLG